LDLSQEKWREYDFMDGANARTYRIVEPASLYVGTTTHRVVDKGGTVHCVPAPGFRGCILRWEPKDKANPVQF
jgi:hypothetical protein